MQSVSGLLKEINRYGRQYRDVQLAPLGLNSRQGMYIREICAAPGISQEQLTQILRINKSNVARQVAAMEEDGYIERRCCGKDKRVLRLYPTEKAQALLPGILEVMDHWEDCLVEELTEKQREVLEQMLLQIRDNARKRAEEG